MPDIKMRKLRKLKCATRDLVSLKGYVHDNEKGKEGSQSEQKGGGTWNENLLGSVTYNTKDLSLNMPDELAAETCRYKIT